MPKVMVNQKQVKKWLKYGLKSYTIEKLYQIPRSVTEAIAAGRDRPHFFRRPVKDKDNLCSCCGFRKKMPGAKYLCFVCFAKHSEESGIDEHSVLL